LKTNRKARI